VQLIEDSNAIFTEEDEQTDTEVTEMEVETENRRSNSEVDKAGKSIHEGSKHAYRLKQEMPTRWNSCLAMMRSLLQMRNFKEVDNCLKMI
jgi:hypothetical protein